MGSCEFAVLVLVGSAPCRKENAISGFSLGSRATQAAVVQPSLSVKLRSFCTGENLDCHSWTHHQAVTELQCFLPGRLEEPMFLIR